MELTIEREIDGVAVELTVALIVAYIDGGETAIRSGHPDRWTQGCPPSVEFDDAIIMAIEVAGQPAEECGVFRVGGTLTLTQKETDKAQEGVLDDYRIAAAENEVERQLEMEDDDYDYCKY